MQALHKVAADRVVGMTVWTDDYRLVDGVLDAMDDEDVALSAVRICDLRARNTMCQNRVYILRSTIQCMCALFLLRLLMARSLRLVRIRCGTRFWGTHRLPCRIDGAGTSANCREDDATAPPRTRCLGGGLRADILVAGTGRATPFEGHW
jgi:hypothetical protein